ncbi:MAG: hypothetical protein KBS80_00935 [Bacteroidales bacterium]|nr:hypothetical protein [Candidatus Cryptobacteroides choladohippi]
MVYPEVIPVSPSPFQYGEILTSEYRNQNYEEQEKQRTPPYLIGPLLGVVARKAKNAGDNDVGNHRPHKDKRAASQTLQRPKPVAYGVLQPIRPHQREEKEKTDAEKQIVPNADFLNLFHDDAKILIPRSSASVWG